MAETIATAVINIEVNNKEVQKQFNQTRTSLNNNANLISKNFHKNFQAITSSAISAANRINKVLRAAFVPMVAFAGVAIKKFMGSTMGENAKRSWNATRQALDESLARIGGMVWQSKIFGKTIEGWVRSLTEFLNKLTSADIRKFVKSLERIAVIMATLKGAAMFAGMVSGIEKLIYSLESLKRTNIASNIGGGLLGGVGGGMAAKGDLFGTFLKGGGSQRSVQGALAGLLAAQAALTKTQSAFSILFKTILRWASVIFAGLAAVTGLLKGLGWKFSTSTTVIGRTMDLIDKVFTAIEEAFIFIGMGFETIGASIRTLFTGEDWTNTINQVFKDWKKGVKGRWSSKGGGGGGDEPLSRGIIDDLNAQFSSIITAQLNYLQDMQEYRSKLENALKGATTLEAAEKIRMQLESVDKAIEGRTKLFDRDIEDFKKAMGNVDDITKGSESFKNLEKYVDDMLGLLGRIGEDTASAIEKTMGDIEKAMDIMRVERQYQKGKTGLEGDLAKQTTDIQNRIAKVKTDMSQGLGFSGTTMQAREGATFAAQVQFDWARKLADYNQQIAEINQEGNQKLDEIRGEIKTQNDNWARFQELLKKGFGVDFAQEMSF